MEDENTYLQGNRFALLLSTEGEDGAERILRQKKENKSEKKIATSAVGSRQKGMDQSTKAKSDKTNKTENKMEKRNERPRTGRREGIESLAMMHLSKSLTIIRALQSRYAIVYVSKGAV